MPVSVVSGSDIAGKVKDKDWPACIFWLDRELAKYGGPLFGGAVTTIVIGVYTGGVDGTSFVTNYPYNCKE